MDRVTALVNSRIKSYTTLRLVNRLREISGDLDFPIIAVITLETDEQRQKLLDIIERGSLTDEDEITMLAWDIRDGYI